MTVATPRVSQRSPWIAEGMKPCDPQIFCAAVDAWETAQRVPLRTEPPKGSGYVLSDIPINRAALGVVKFLRERGVLHPQAYLIRLMHMGEVFDNAASGGPLAKFIKPSEEDSSACVSEALLHAVALAPIRLPADLSTGETMLDLEAIRGLADAAWMANEEASGGH